jgi:uncharacterized OB-fold protein
VPAVDGWFTMDDPPRLIGGKCAQCGTYVFPPRSGTCPNPDCDSSDLAPVELSNRGTVWSYTENRYPPPPPFQASDPFEPYAIAAVELADEGMIVLGQVAKGVLAADLEVGMEMELELDVLYRDDECEHLVWTWAPVARSAT